MARKPGVSLGGSIHIYICIRAAVCGKFPALSSSKNAFHHHLLSKPSCNHPHTGPAGEHPHRSGLGRTGGAHNQRWPRIGAFGVARLCASRRAHHALPIRTLLSSTSQMKNSLRQEMPSWMTLPRTGPMWRRVYARVHRIPILCIPAAEPWGRGHSRIL